MSFSGCGSMAFVWQRCGGDGSVSGVAPVGCSGQVDARLSGPRGGQPMPRRREAEGDGLRSRGALREGAEFVEEEGDEDAGEEEGGDDFGGAAEAVGHGDAEGGGGDEAEGHEGDEGGVGEFRAVLFVEGEGSVFEFFAGCEVA